MSSFNIQCPHCHVQQTVEHPGGYAPIYANCEACGNKFILEPVQNGVMTYKPGEAPCCSDPDCRETEMGDSGND